MTLTNRRALLLVGAATIGGMGMGGTSTCTPSSATTLTQQVIDAIQAAVATACGFVPSVATLLAVVSMFPGIGGAAAIAAFSSRRWIPKRNSVSSSKMPCARHAPAGNSNCTTSPRPS